MTTALAMTAALAMTMVLAVSFAAGWDAASACIGAAAGIIAGWIVRGLDDRARAGRRGKPG